MNKRADDSASSIEYCLLGLLGDRPMHGYELHRELSRKTGLGLIWTVKQAQLYAILAKLEAEGLIAAELLAQTHRPARHVFHLTEAGGRAFRAWIGEPVARRSFRLDFPAKLYFARRAGAEELQRLVIEQRRLCALWLEEMSNRGLACEEGELDSLVYRYRVGQLEATLRWLDECLAWSAAPREAATTSIRSQE
jgi:PadR family transcriptional regulator, regulatory protein AphA